MAKSSKLKFKKNAILLYRYGSDNAVKQIGHNKLPSEFKRGVWAFPFPYMEMFFVVHRADLLLKKTSRYRTDVFSEELNPDYNLDTSIEDRKEKFKLFKRTITTFWYDKPILSRIGKPGCGDCRRVDNGWWYWDNPKVWSSFIHKELPNLKYNCYSKDHLELFCPMKGK